jgi:uncharacterized protein (TIGR03435 family)
MPVLSQAPAQKPSFEVASIKRSKPDARGSVFNVRGDRFVMTNTPLKRILQFAYFMPGKPLSNDQIIGGPNWIGTDRFDIEAKAEGDGQRIPLEQVRSMLQTLLEDRFQLKAHNETRDLPVYILTVAKGGLKLRLSEDQSPPSPVTAPPPRRPGESPTMPRGTFSVEGGPSGLTLVGSALQLRDVIANLQVQMDHPIVDKTDLKGLYDIRLQFAPEVLLANTGGISAAGIQPVPPSQPTAPSIFTAVDDLGLKLESAKVPLEVIVIDSVQKPSEN